MTENGLFLGITKQWVSGSVVAQTFTQILTCGSATKMSLDELTDLEAVALLAFLLSVLPLLLFLPPMAVASTGGGGKGLGTATLD